MHIASGFGFDTIQTMRVTLPVVFKAAGQDLTNDSAVQVYKHKLELYDETKIIHRLFLVI